MNRRSFLKGLGLLLAAPAPILKAIAEGQAPVDGWTGDTDPYFFVIDCDGRSLAEVYEHMKYILREGTVRESELREELRPILPTGSFSGDTITLDPERSFVIDEDAVEQIRAGGWEA